MNLFTEKYMEYSREFCDAPDIFHFFMSYAVLSSVMNRRVWFPSGDGEIYPNIYMLLIAPSTKYRKSTVLAIANKIIKMYEPKHILPTEFSHEKLISLMAANPVGTMFHYEFKTLMASLDATYNAATKSFLTGIYDCPDEYRRLTGASDLVIDHPFTNILSATTVDWLEESVKSGDMSGGFLSRFIYVPAHEKTITYTIPPESNKDKRNALLVMLKDLSNNVRGRFELSIKARKVYDDWYYKHMDFIDNSHNQISSVLERATNYVIKFALLDSLDAQMPGKLTIDEYSMQHACNMIDWVNNNVCKLFSDFGWTKFEKQLGKIRQYIYQKDNGLGITKSKLLMNFKMPTFDMDKYIQTLKDQDMIFLEVKSGDNGKRGLTIFANKSKTSIPIDHKKAIDRMIPEIKLF